MNDQEKPLSLTGSAVMPPKSAPKSLVIFLHGLGSNADDLLGLAPYFAKDLPHTGFISPNAPERCDMTPPGYMESYQWFSLQDRDPDKMEQGAGQAHVVLKDFIFEVSEKYNVPINKIVLVGFSQGTMMSLYTGTRLGEELAGILGYSGALLSLDTESNQSVKPRIHLIHGEQDDVVPFDAMQDACDALEGNGFDVNITPCPDLGHSIDQKGLDLGVKFVTDSLTNT